MDVIVGLVLYYKLDKKTIDQRYHLLSLHRDSTTCSMPSASSDVSVTGCDLRPRQLSLASPYMVGISVTVRFDQFVDCVVDYWQLL